MTTIQATSLDKALNKWVAAQIAEKASLKVYAAGPTGFSSEGRDAYAIVQNARAETRKAEGVYTRLFRRFNAGK